MPDVLFRTATVLLLSLTPAPSAANDDRNFSGAWVLTATRGQVNALPDPPGDLLIVKLSRDKIDVESRTAESDGPSNFSYALDGTSSRNKSEEFSLSSVLKWEADALLFNTIANSSDTSYTQMDRWELSRDGTRLAIRRQVVDRNGQVEALLTYERR